MIQNGEPWFILADVCKVLGIKNSRDAKARLKEADKGVRSMDTLGGKQQVSVVNERGLYMTIMRSDKPEALDFQMWISGEVIPSIRRHGAYVTPEKIEEVLFKAPTVTAGLAESHFFVLEL